MNALKVVSHSWKMIEPRTQTTYGTNSEFSFRGTHRSEGYDWGFKVVIEFAQQGERTKTEWGDPSFMPIEAIQYDLYDDDGFHFNQPGSLIRTQLDEPLTES
jgi:hypothetical protein